MRGGLIILALLGAWFAVENMTTTAATVVGLLTLAGILAAAVALAVKWVRNV